MQLNRVFIRPLMTEKGANLAKGGSYMFEVHMNSTKPQVRTALETLYKVKVKEVKLLIRKGKEKRAGRRMTTKQLPDKKIAVVTLKEGKIDLFPAT